MKVESFIKILNADFYTGVPDSLLRPFCDYLMNTYGIDKNHHIIAANEGNCVAIAAGHYMATGKIPIVYMQNSGEGNIINPVASLLNSRVYAIPMIFVIGWRGEPGVHDEPQHIYQGEITRKLLYDMEIENYVVTPDTSEEELKDVMKNFFVNLSDGKDVAFVIGKGALTFDNKVEYQNGYTVTRENVISHIVNISGIDPIISTTGKASRELFEIRERNNQSHKYDFLTVGSMGHSSSIALGVALSIPEKKVWCIDGDGAAIMHMGAIAVIGSTAPKNFIHILINNEAHESVGGMPTVSKKIDMKGVAKACGYSYAVCVDNYQNLDRELLKVKQIDGPSFIEVKCKIGSRNDLGRPTTTTIQNKVDFMSYLSTNNNDI